MSATHVAARVEDGFHRRLIPFLRNRGWRPRTISYIGYGNSEFVRVLGRVVLGRQLHEAGVDVSVQEDLIARRGWRSFVTAPVSYLPVTVRVGGTDHRALTDRSGYLDLIVGDH